MNSRATRGDRDESSRVTSSVTIRAPDAAKRETKPWPISPSAPVMRTTGVRIASAILANCRRQAQPVTGQTEPNAYVGSIHAWVDAEASYEAHRSALDCVRHRRADRWRNSLHEAREDPGHRAASG